ncbi:L-histidine N(alpha)-methyltransferase [Croceimicrobium sp.]|uniref:L-histidine N(alpha)-methyltransferase n=1 Tax=Croceimicrobium sp. TaxID=2828340 RepID=UPI003BAD032F
MSNFLREVIEGLEANDKYLLSKYFYNSEGDRLFQQIMQLDEYYLSKAEAEILKEQSPEICRHFPEHGFRLAELGAGDGTKTRYLLEAALANKTDFSYHPIDISSNALDIISSNLKHWLPNLNFEPMADEYFSALSRLAQMDDKALSVLFLGSNIGNFRRDNVDVFMNHLHKSLKPGDQVLLGVDLKKDPNKILAAYNDSMGITAAFNFNILRRINDELGGQFDLSKFRHYNNYDPHSGESRSYLLSLEEQDVYIEKAQKSFHFDRHEAIHTETSRKYSPRDLEQLALKHGFKVEQRFSDSQSLYEDQLWIRV